MVWDAQIVIDGDPTVYSYPDGPVVPNHRITRVGPGLFLVDRGNALLDPGKPNERGQVAHLPRHHVKVHENGAFLFDQTIETHFWNTCYAVRSDTAQLAIKKSPAQIFAAKLAPLYGDTGNQTRTSNVPPYGSYPGTSNITTYMPTTGERPDIGLLTDAAARYLLTGNPDAMFAWADSAGSMPYHWHDTSTGLMPDIIKYPGINSYDAPGYQGAPFNLPSPYVIKGPQNDGGYFAFGNNCCPQNAHWCDMTYVATVATEDPILLLYTQRAAEFNIGASAELFTKTGARVMAGEYRGIAHGLGMLFKARAATVDAIDKGYFIPGFHMPVKYFDDLLANSLEFYAGHLSDPQAQRFHVNFAGYSTVGPWQHEYLMMDLAFAVLSGKTDWITYFIEMLKFTVDRFSGKSGWPPAFSAYYIDLHADDTSLLPDCGALFDHLYQSEQANAATAAAHGQDYTPSISTATYNMLKANPMNGGVMVGTTEYTMTSHAVLRFANYLEKLGLVDVRGKIPFFDEALANNEILFRSLGSCNPRVSVVDVLGAPPVVVPPPVVIPPTNPPGEIHMSDTAFTLAPGQSKQLDFLDDAGHPAVLSGTPTVEQTAANVFSLQLNAQGLLVSSTGVPGVSKITVHAVGANGPLTANSVGTVAPPLSSSLNLVPRG